jgi:glycosyltransferase involved in cell wall biosynthesis
MPKALCDFHHTDLFRAFQILFEKRFGWELYRPSGREWYPRFYWHPIEVEALVNLTVDAEFNPLVHKSVLPDKKEQAEGVLYRRNGLNDGVRFRWLPLDRVKEMDLIICTIARNEARFFELRRHYDLHCPIIRYTGNIREPLNLDHFDIFLPAYYPDYEQYVKTGLKPGLLYHPEFDEDLYCYTPVPVLEKPIIRSFLNFMYHHREPGSMYEKWMHYVRYGEEIGAVSYMHGVGVPPAGIDLDLDMPMDIALEKIGRLDLLDRSKWPDLRFNRGEAPNHPTIAELMKLSNFMIHPKTDTEGYGFVIHEFASCGRPVVVPRHYETLSARCFLQDKESCIYITGDDTTDKANFHWAMKPENNARLSQTIHRRFKENVSFEDEAAKIEALL